MSDCSSLYFTDANAAVVAHFLQLQRHNDELNFKIHLARPSAALACGVCLISINRRRARFLDEAKKKKLTIK